MPVFSVFAEISDACPPVIPTFKVLSAISVACPAVIPTFAVFAVISDACPPVIVVVFPANAVVPEVPKTIYLFADPSAISSVSKTTTPISPFTESTAPPPPVSKVTTPDPSSVKVPLVTIIVSTFATFGEPSTSRTLRTPVTDELGVAEPPGVEPVNGALHASYRYGVAMDKLNSTPVNTPEVCSIKGTVLDDTISYP